MSEYGDKYKVYLKNGNIVYIWFIGKQIEKIFKSYNVKYKKILKGGVEDE